MHRSLRSTFDLQDFERQLFGCRPSEKYFAGESRQRPGDLCKVLYPAASNTDCSQECPYSRLVPRGWPLNDLPYTVLQNLNETANTGSDPERFDLVAEQLEFLEREAQFWPNRREAENGAPEIRIVCQNL